MVENITVKALDFEHFKEIIEIQKMDGWRHVYYLTKDRLKELVRRGEVFYGIYLNDKMIGFAGVDIEIRANLHFMSIDKKYQRKGYATLFLEKLFVEMKKKKIKQVFFYIEPESPHVAFLQKQGFEKVGFYKNRFGDGWDADIYEYKI